MQRKTKFFCVFIAWGALSLMITHFSGRSLSLIHSGRELNVNGRLINVPGSELNVTVRDRAIQGILKASESIVKVDKLCSSRASGLRVKEAYNELTDVLQLLGHKQDLQEAPPDTPTAVNTDLCQENYSDAQMPSSNRSHFIYYFRGGYYTQDCPGAPKFSTLLTVVYNFVHYSPNYFKLIPNLIHQVNRLYPKLRVVAAIPQTLSLEENAFADTTLITINTSYAGADIWSKLIAQVGTKYVYIGRNVVSFTWFERLERLIRQINNLKASVVASAYRTLDSGKWSNGCEQSVLSNYMLVYKHGYDVSMQECLVCHHVHGPFAAKTDLFSKVTLQSNATATSAFAMWFLKLKDISRRVVSCPDVMSYVSDESVMPSTRKDWKDLVSILQVERVRLNKDLVMAFSCREARTSCPEVRATGKALSLCCKKELADAVKLVMRKCREGGMVCQMIAGTALGAIKFNNILPWEIDADIWIRPENLSAFNDLRPFFVERGYRWDSGLNATDKHVLVFSPHWIIEVYAGPIEIPSSLGVTPTVVDFDGEYLETITNPGHSVRNEYGSEIYQHVQHWRHLASTESFGFYSRRVKSFSKCPSPGHHSCLDQFTPDGNFIFQEPVL